jgi:alkylhydroperoxidase family enzyme
MAFISYVPPEAQRSQDRVDDPDHIIQVHSVHPAIMRQHLELYRQLMHRSGPLTRREREILATRVSALNGCRY